MNRDDSTRRRLDAGDHPQVLTSRQLELLRSRLLEERAAVEVRIRLHVEQAIAEDPTIGDQIDRANVDLERESLLEIANHEHRLLQEIDAALARMATGRYGICEGTGDAIALGRLLTRPWARFSLQYAEELEHGSSLRSTRRRAMPREE
jgi:DnaK suppressor protein